MTKYIILFKSDGSPTLVLAESVEAGYCIESGLRALAGKRSRAKVYSFISKNHMGISL